MSSIRYCYRTLEFGHTDIHIRTLKDRQQYSDDSGVANKLGISSAQWPLFGMIWPSSEILAHLMFNFDISGKRILEVGCGIGLSSLVLNQRNADISATDYHPEVKPFLEYNVILNQGREIPFTRLGWDDGDLSMGTFDLIIGSDLLYEREHVNLLSNFILQHAKPTNEVIMVDPGRGHHARFSKRMVKMGYSHSQAPAKIAPYLDTPFKGQVLRYFK